MRSSPRLGLAAPLALALTACAGRGGTVTAPPDVTAHRLSGVVTFEADFRVDDGPARPAPPSWSLVPTGHSPVPRLEVCAFQQRGGHDLAAGGHLRDDRKLVCATTDDEGRYSFELPRSLCRTSRDGHVRCDPRIYLATTLCAMKGDRAQVCVGSNETPSARVHDENWKQLGKDRKLLWSPSYRLDLEARTSNLVAWNLSCPADDGLGRPELSCDRPSRGGYFDRTHSNTGYNRESVHAYWAGAMTVARFGDLVPRGRTTLAPGGRHCTSEAAPGWKRRECSDAIRIVLTRMRHFGGEQRLCVGKRSADHVRARNAVCIGSPRNPWVVAHELGHALHLRWMNYDGKLNHNIRGKAVRESNKTQTSEGFADFVAASVLHDRNDERPTFNGRNMVEATRRSCPTNRRAVAEISAAMVFWDLWDPAHATEPTDRVQVDLRTILEVWSMFAGGDGESSRDRTKGECNPDGRNLFDFEHYWTHHPDDLPDIRPLLQAHCVDWQEPRSSCTTSHERNRRRRSRPDHQ